MFQKLPRNKYLSPDQKYNIYPERSVISPTNLLNRYGSLKYLEKQYKPLESANQIKKKIENYTYSSADCIGEGYTSKVYKAYRDGSSQIYAIKVVDLKKFSENNKDMLQSEISIIKTMNHPNIIKCYDVFTTLNNCYIITEYCEGGDLMNYMKKKTKMDTKTTKRIFKQILMGINYLADNLIVHRDLKPANIFFKEGKCKIADFGFAKRIQQLKNRQSYNVGTPLYMPPQALLKNIYSIKSDIFSVGIIFYEMIFGLSPWQSRNQKELINKMLKQPLKFPSIKQFDKELKEFIQGCLAIDIENRFDLQKINKSDLYQMLMNNPEQLSEELVSQKKRNVTTGENIGKQQFTKLTKIKSDSQKLSNQIPKKIFDRNSTIILNQINFCRFIYYMIKNRIPLLKALNQKQLLNTILYKHLLKIINQLSDSSSNWFKLKEYDVFKKSMDYEKLQKMIKQYQLRYQSEFNLFNKQLKRQNTEDIFTKIQELNNYDQLKVDRQYFKIIMSLIKFHIKQLNQNITIYIKLNKENQIKSSIEGLKSLVKYYNILQISVNHYQNYEYFTDHSSITVLTNYTNSTATRDTFTELRQKIMYMNI